MPEITVENAEREAIRLKEWTKIREELRKEGLDRMKALQAPFSEDEIKWKPQAVKGDRALAIAYIDARLVMDRLDEVVGGENWSDSYQVLGEGNVMCSLSLRINGDWITKSDVGGQSDQPDAGDRQKAAFSDSFKRAAVKFGIGRFLYSLKQSWEPYDVAKKRFRNRPTMDLPPEPEEVPIVTLDPGQQKAIRDLLAKSPVTLEEFLKLAKVPSIDAIPADRFEAATNWIKKKINEAMQKGQQQQAKSA